MKLRKYQEEAVSAALNSDGNSLIVCPTGAGKSLIIAGIIAKVLEVVPNANILVLQHRKELVEQNFDKFIKLCPEHYLKGGIYSASVGQKDIKQITFGQIQSIHKQALPLVNIIIVDECHLINDANTGMFRSVIDRLRSDNPNLFIVGLTATPFRLSSGLIMEGKNRIFNDIAYDIGIRELISQGFLSPLKSKCGSVAADLKNVRIRSGEYVIEDLENAMSPLTEAACDEIVLLGKTRKHWLLFSTSVAHAEALTAALQKRGVRAACVHGGMPISERERVLRDYEAGVWQALVNCEIATVGYDFPGIDLIAILRATKSAGLFVQICGRGLRIEDGKTDCLILDYGQNLERFGCIDNIKVRKKRDGFQLMLQPVKLCPKCGNALPVTTVRCECGHVFERASTPHEAEASSRPVLSQEMWLDIKGIEFKVHSKVGGNNSLKVVYHCEGDTTVREFLCFNHPLGSYPHKKAYQWWSRHSVNPTEMPKDVSDAFFKATAGQIKPIRKIRVIPQPDNAKFMQVLGYEYGAIEVEDKNEGIEENIF